MPPREQVRRCRQEALTRQPIGLGVEVVGHAHRVVDDDDSLATVPLRQGVPHRLSVRCAGWQALLQPLKKKKYRLRLFGSVWSQPKFIIVCFWLDFRRDQFLPDGEGPSVSAGSAQTIAYQACFMLQLGKCQQQHGQIAPVCTCFGLPCAVGGRKSPCYQSVPRAPVPAPARSVAPRGT